MSCPGAAGAACARLRPTPILRALRKAIEPVQYCYMIQFISESQYSCKYAKYVKPYTEYAKKYAEYHIMKNA
jgi:hypothetical protein